MRGLVLAAGRGSRLGSLTADRPKCLVEIAGRSLLDRQVAALRAAGVDEVGVVTGWHAEAFAGTGLPTFRNPRWRETTMVESLAAAEDWLFAGPVLVSYGDIVFGADTARRLAGTPGQLAVAYDPHWEALWRSRFTDPLDDAETFRVDGDRLTDIGGRPTTTDHVQGQYLGLVRWTPQAWHVVRHLRSTDPETRGLDMTGLLRRLVRGDALHVTAVPTDGPWCEFDHPSDIDVGADVLRRLDAELVS